MTDPDPTIQRTEEYLLEKARKAGQEANKKRKEFIDSIMLEEQHLQQQPIVSASMRQVGGDHYTQLKVQPWDALEAWMSPGEFQA